MFCQLICSFLIKWMQKKSSAQCLIAAKQHLFKKKKKNMQRSEGTEVNFCFIPKGKGRMVGQSREVKTLVACLLG